jgi:peptidoglycan L-alanyl-D-glutamate endopeptidase CwlK
MYKSDVQQINRDKTLLAPFFAKRLQIALDECHAQGMEIEMFEGFRGEDRQDYLYAQGRTREGKIVTKARGGQSFHQYGIACDLCFKWGGKWQWNKDDPWDKVHEIFHRHGFETLSFEKAHVQITSGIKISKAFTISKERGLLALWSIIESGCKPLK